jgi:hypothetical protein
MTTHELRCFDFLRAYKTFKGHKYHVMYLVLVRELHNIHNAHKKIIEGQQAIIRSRGQFSRIFRGAK